MAGNTTRSEANQSFFMYVKDTNTGVVKRVAIPGDVQIGLEGQPAELHLFGRFSVAATSYVVDQSNKGVLNVSNDDTVVAVTLAITPITGRIKVHLPTNPRDGQLHFIKDMTGTADTVPIDVVPSPGLTVDNQAFRTLSDPYGSLALIWLAGQWRLLVAGLGASGGSGSPTNASYVTINPEVSLTSERHLTGSANVKITDNGPKASVVIDLTSILGSGAGTFTYATVTVDQFGRITAINNGVNPPPAGASYITAVSEGGLPGDRVLTGSVGVVVVDNGAGTNVGLSIDPTFFVAGPGISLNTGSTSHNITISAVATTIDPWVDLGTGRISTTSSVSITGSLNVTRNAHITGSLSVIGNLSVTGSSIFGGNVLATSGLSGSLQRLTDGITSYIDCIGGLSIFTKSNGQVIISGSSLNAQQQDLNSIKQAQFVLLQLTSSLPQSRLLSAGPGITIVDSGPLNLLSIQINNNVVATVSGTTFTGAVKVPSITASLGIIAQGTGPGGGFSGSLQLLADGHTPYLIGVGGTTVFTQSNGQVIISSSLTAGGSSTTAANVFTPFTSASAGTTSSIAIDSQGRQASQIGSDVFFFVSGTIGLPPGATGRKVAVFGGGTYISGSLIVSGAFSGSHSTLADGITPYIVGIGGINVFTQSNGQVVISGSGGSSGGTTTGINALNQGTSLVNNPYPTLNFTGSGVTAVDSGIPGQANIIVQGDFKAPYALAAATSSLPNSRTLTAGPGLSIVDNGPGGSLVIGFTGATQLSQSAIVYDGYCTGSLQWSATDWTDFFSVPGNFVDVNQNGIVRSGSTWTVGQTGYYLWRSTFNADRNSGYIAFRLSGSNGVLLQRTIFDNSTAAPDGQVEGIVQLNSGSAVRLQYLVKAGSSVTWTVSDPIGSDAENMRTGHVLFTQLANPVTITNVPTTAPFGWQTGYFVDFTKQTSGSFGGNGTQIFNGVPWYVENYGNARSIGILPTNGLEFSDSTANTDYGFAGNRNSPLLSLRMQDAFAGFNYSTMPFRVWTLLGPNNIANDTEAVFLAIERWSFGGGSSGENYTEKKLHTTNFGFQAQASLNNANVFNQSVDTSHFEHDVIMLQWLDDRQVEYWTGTSVTGSFPDASTLTLRGTALISNASFFQAPISGSYDFGFVIGACTNNTNGTLNAAFKQFKFEYFQSNPGAVLNSSVFISGTYPAADPFDTLYWPLHESQGAVAFNQGTGGATGHLTASSTSVRFDQPGAVRTSVGVNVNGATSNYLVTANGITPPFPANSGSFTVSAWCFPTSFNNLFNKIVHKAYFAAQNTWNSPFDTLGITQFNNSTGEVEYFVNTGSTGGYAFTTTTSNSLGLNMWNHVGFTFDAPNKLMSCYLNGAIVGTVTITNTNDHADISQNGWWGVGGNVAIPTSEYWPGNIEDVRVANTVRSATWFNQMWLGGRPDATPAINLALYVTSSGGSSLSGTSGPNAWVEGGAESFRAGTQIRTTSSVAISDGTENSYAGTKGTDVFFYVSGTQGGVSGPSPYKSLFGGDVVVSGTLAVIANVVASNITGSITQLPGNLGPYIVGIGGTKVSTGSSGQIIISSSLTSGGGSGGTSGVNVQNQGATLPASPYTIINFTGPGVSTSDVGGVATVNIPGSIPGSVPGSFAVYYGFCTGSLLWSGSGSWHDFSEVATNFRDVKSINVQRNGSSFAVLQTGYYRFQSFFNAMAGANGTYISFRLSGSASTQAPANGTLIEHTTFATDNPQPAILEGIVQLNSGDVVRLQYQMVASASAEQAWTPADPLGPSGSTENMWTGKVDFFLIPSGSATVNQYQVTASIAGGAYSQANFAIGTGSNSFDFDSSVQGFRAVPNLSATLTTSGYPVLVMANASYVSRLNGSQAFFSLSRDNIHLGAPFGGLMGAGPLLNTFSLNAGFAFVDFVGAGTHTYRYLASGSVGSGSLTAQGAGPGALMVFEMKGANVVTASTSLQQAVSGGDVIGLSASINPVKGPVLAIYSGEFGSDLANNWVSNTIKRNGVNFAGNTNIGISVGSTANEMQNISITVLDTGVTLGATNTYTVAYTNGQGSNTVNRNSVLSSLILWELTDVNWKYALTNTAIGTGGSYTDVVPTTPVNGLMTRGRPVMLIGTVQSNTTTATGRSGWSFLRNGSSITTASKGFQVVDGEGTNDWNRQATMYWFDQVNAGFNQYQLAGFNISGSQSTAQTPGGVTALLMYELDAGGPGFVAGGWLDEGNLLFTTASIQVIGNAVVGGSETLAGPLSVTNPLVTSVISGSLVILGTLTFASGSGLPITGSSVSRRQALPLLSAMVTSPQFSGSKANLGVGYYDPTKLNNNIDVVRHFFRGTFAPVFGNGNAYIDLYDYNGILTGIPGPVSGTVLTASNPSALTKFETEVTSLFQGVTGSGILMARGWCDPSGSNFINVGGVELGLEWR